MLFDYEHELHMGGTLWALPKVPLKPPSWPPKHANHPVWYYGPFFLVTGQSTLKIFSIQFCYIADCMEAAQWRLSIYGSDFLLSAHFLGLAKIVQRMSRIYEVLFPCCPKNYCHLLFNHGPDILSHRYASAEVMVVAFWLNFCSTHPLRWIYSSWSRAPCLWVNTFLEL